MNTAQSILEICFYLKNCSILHNQNYGFVYACDKTRLLSLLNTEISTAANLKMMMHFVDVLVYPLVMQGSVHKVVPSILYDSTHEDSNYETVPANKGN